MFPAFFSARLRCFVRFGLALAFLCAALPARALAQAAVPLDPTLIPKYVDPLPLPSALDGAATSAGAPLQIRMSEFQQKLLPASFYTTLPAPWSNGAFVWGYNGSTPGPTIVARRGTPTWVRYENALANADGSPLYLQGTLTVDQTLHWANPLGTQGATTPYTGPVPAAVHLHGGEVPSAYDGGPDAWWTPGLAQRGPSYVTDTFAYPNDQEGTAMFYHDHALGMTRINVFAGLAGFYLLRDPSLEPANLPGGPADAALDRFGKPYEIGLAIQDRMFDTNGQLYFPSNGTNPAVHPFWIPEFLGNVVMVNGKAWAYLDVEPRRYRFRIVNGSNARFYELRLLDRATDKPGPGFWQIGSDGGLLDAPVFLNNPAVKAPQRLLIAPGERVDLVIDFAAYAGRTFTLVNSGRSPYPKGAVADPKTTGQVMQFRVAAKVPNAPVDASLDPSRVSRVRLTPIERPARVPVRRALTLNEDMGPLGPLQVLVNNTNYHMMPTEELQVGDTEVWEIINLTADTHPMHLHLLQFQLLERQTFSPSRYLGVYGMPMPGMGGPFPYGQRDAATGFKLGGNPDVTPFLQGVPIAPDPNERGWKDTFRMNPGEVTRVLVRVAPQDAEARAARMGVSVQPGVNLFSFDPGAALGETDTFGYPGGPGYVWHCHIIDHEDNDMMRPLQVCSAPMPMRPAVATDSRVAATRPALEFAPVSPNPVREHASFRFTLAREGEVSLDVLDVNGRLVSSIERTRVNAGAWSLEWDLRDRDGRDVSAGAYFCRVRAGGAEAVRKFVVVR
ncbi:MAG: multicopper oxidase domain-containing protein [Candidatus Eisenbacteria bacterium]|uniref:Multicopper oxidase domain-containing protein n=1 Tax=Eiseniibacteriota bacterium TaxID=2212470 RepID=A0A933SDD4_UNCEI|nr:multicopper oxidase domain-containing protein [Candidatus Eisenbacteria bacterium]